MSYIEIKDASNATRKIKSFPRTEGADTVETQGNAVVDPITGDPIEFATETTLAALLSAANAIKAAAEALNTKATTINTGAVAGTVELGATSLAALESVSIDNLPAAPLTDAQLRATSLPLPTGAATELTLAALQTLLTTLNGTVGNHNAPFVDGSPGQVMLAKRRDSDTTSVADGDLNTLNMDETGRLKVASQPASYADTTGSITANGGTVFANVDRASNVTISMVATSLVGHNAIFEYSNNSTDGSNGTWYNFQVARSNANTADANTGVLAATPAYGWEASVNAYKWIRIRATAHTSGTAAYIIKQGTYATEPVPIIQVTGTQPVSGTVTATVTAGTVNPVVPATPYFINSLATTNIALILTGTSGLHALWATNTGATVAFVKLYNKATAPVLASDIPEMIIPVPAAVSGVPGVAQISPGFSAYRFALGLGIAITGAVADTDTTAVAAGQVKVKISRTV